jgi:HTH-type transcriptional regulator/antitoxin MqsA
MFICNLCHSYEISILKAKDSFTYKGQKIEFEVEYSVCNSCGKEFIDSQQIQKNDATILNAKKFADGLLSSEEIQEIRTNLGLTQEMASKVFGGGENAFSKYESGKVAQSAAMDKLLRLAEEFPFVFNWLMTFSGYTVKLKDNSAYNASENLEDYRSVATNKEQYKISSSSTLEKPDGIFTLT